MKKHLHSFSKRQTLFLAFITVLTFSFFTYLYFSKPFYADFRAWFFRYKIKTIGAYSPLFLGFVLSLLTPSLLGKTHRLTKQMGFVYFFSVFLQFSFALSMGKGLFPLFKGIHSSGHSEFARSAQKIESTHEAISQYEKLKTKTKGGFIESKPPGTVLFYYYTKKIADFLFPFLKNKKLAFFLMELLACFLWPFFSMLVLIPLYFLTRHFFSSYVSLVACLLYGSTPMTSLVTMHMDQVLYPLLFVTTLLLGVKGSQKSSLPLLFLAGLSLYLSVFCTFGMLTLFPFLGLFYFSLSGSLIKSLKDLSFTIMGFSLFYGFMYFVMNYNTFENYQQALSHSRSWVRATEFSWARFWYSGKINFFEYGTYLGLPLLFTLALSFVSRSKAFLLSLKKMTFSPEFVFSFGTFFIILFMHGFQRNTAEVIRLWLFTSSLFSVSGALFLTRFFRGKIFTMLPLFISLQWLCILIIKIRTDFT